jgi:SMODS and SLOG-associating 2TM effector domain 1/SMODS and SLOG-associating 2TM effector domain 3
MMLVTLCVSTALRLGKFDDRWFRCRAFAENLKSIIWRFVMTSPIAADDAEAIYLSEVRELKKRLPDLEKEFIVHGGSGDLITAWMRTTQALPISSKTALYRKDRLEDQITWYSEKASQNARSETRWFWFVFVVEFVAILCAAYQAWQLKEMNLVGGVASIGTAVIAWSQIKRFSDLDTSYAIAAGDLRSIGTARQKVETQVQLDLFVHEVETAVSREHSMWLARRVIGS